MSISTAGKPNWIQKLLDWHGEEGTPDKWNGAMGIHDSSVPFSWTGTAWTPEAASLTINYSLDYNDLSLSGGPASPAAIQATQTLIDDLLARISAVTKITFQRNDDDPSIVFAKATLGTGILGQTLLDVDQGNQTNTKADIYISQSLSAGDAAFQETLLHEVLHALGISHPGESAVTDPNLAANDAAFDQSLTMMSDRFPGGAGHTDHYPLTPMVYDIATLQFLYGANTTTNSGNTTYTINLDQDGITTISVSDDVRGSSSIGGTTVAIWDAGGTDIFQLDSSLTSDAVIDLRAGKHDQVVSGPLAYSSLIGTNVIVSAMPDPAIGAPEGYGIIDNASGSSGNDKIYGNQLANTLSGLGGADTIDGGAGTDKLVGGDGADVLYGHATADTVEDDTLDGGDGDDIADYSPAQLAGMQVLHGTGSDVVHKFEIIDEIPVDRGTDTLTSIKDVIGVQLPFNNTIDYSGMSSGSGDGFTFTYDAGTVTSQEGYPASGPILTYENFLTAVSSYGEQAIFVANNLTGTTSETPLTFKTAYADGETQTATFVIEEDLGGHAVFDTADSVDGIQSLMFTSTQTNVNWRAAMAEHSDGGINYADFSVHGAETDDTVVVSINKDVALKAGVFIISIDGYEFAAGKLIDFLEENPEDLDSGHGVYAGPWLPGYLRDAYNAFFAGDNSFYHYKDGDGASSVSESAGSNDTLKFDYVSAATATYTKSSTDLVVGYGTLGDTVTVEDFFNASTTDHRIERAYFAGGTIHDLNHILKEVFTQTGTSGADALTGQDYVFDPRDYLNGLGGNDTLNGGTGDDTIDGGTGTDSMTGGTGNDLYVVDDAGDVVTEGSSAGTDTIQTALTYSLASYANVENLTLTGSTAINGTGNSTTNVITGNSVANTLDGGTGADTLVGGAGNDTYIVDNASDVVTENASEGTDLVQASVTFTLGANIENLTLTGTTISGTGNSLDNILIGSSSANTLIGLGGNDTLDGGAGADSLDGGAGDDLYIIDNASDVIVTANESSGTDTVQSSVSWTLNSVLENLTLAGTGNINGTGNSSVNTITGNIGNNSLDGQGGNDVLIGGTGNDTYIVDSSGDSITENSNEGTDTVRSSVSFTLGSNIENLTLTGTTISGTGNSLNNVITGSSSVNTLSGLDGNDTLDGGAGADTLIGGLGNDTYTIDDAGDVVTENTSEGSDTVNVSFTASLASYANVENLTLLGSGNFNATGISGTNILTGNSGTNTLDGGAGADTMQGDLGDDVYIVDDAGDVVIETDSFYFGDLVKSSVTYTLGSNVENLTLTGTGDINGTGNSYHNLIIGNSGNNILDGGGSGADSLVGGVGNDTYVVNGGSVTIIENSGEGTDLVQSSMFAFTLADNVENLTLTGSSNINGTGNGLTNTITGNSGDNSLDGSTGADVLIGGKGNDSYIVDNASDSLTENASEGTDLVQSSVTWTLGTNFENLTLTGTTIDGTGNGLDNTLTGSGSANILTALGGNDTLDGSAGADSLVGGAGNDVYIVDNASDVVTENASEGTDLVQSSVSYTISDADVENLTLTGSLDINGTGNTSNNTIIGNGGINSLSGSDGNDTLDGGAGVDTLAGGLGNDVFIVDDTADAVSESASQGTDLVQSSVTYTISDADVENLTLTGSAYIDGTGNASVNIITGNSSDNTLNGSTGADSLIGGAGNDTYVVDNASDTVTENGSEGTDVVQSSVTYTLASNVENLTLTGTTISGTGNTLDNVLTGSGSVNTLTGLGGNDTLDGGAGNDSLVGGTGNDVYIVDSASDAVIENLNEGTDLVQASVTYTISDADVENLTLAESSSINGTGNASNNVITGNGFNNSLDGQGGTDTLAGAGGDDVYVVDSTGDTILEYSGQGSDTVRSSVTYTLSSTQEIENLVLTGTTINGTGNALDNTLTGSSSVNTLTGLGGNDTLDGGAGADSLIGGSGDDTYIVDNASDGITENSSEGTDLVKSSVTHTLALNVENLTLTGTTISGTGNTLDNVLTGSGSVNTLTGLGGNDTLDGGAGNDSLVGGTGNDVYIVDSATDAVIESLNEGTDLVQSSVTYTISDADVENLTLTGSSTANGTGNSSANTITGNSGSNTLDGSTGADALIGGAGDDVFIVDNAGDTASENASEGTDLVKAGVTFTLTSDVENLTLTGTGAINGTGNGSDNVLTGNTGVNVLTGGNGNDTLDGGTSGDTLDGGAGDDFYVIDNASDVILTANETSGIDSVQSSVAFTLGSNLDNLTLTAAVNGTGNSLDNSITGSSGVNTLDGQGGNDTLDGGAGADTMIGGTGNDTFIVGATTDKVTENSGEGNDTVLTDVTGYTLAANVENLVLRGTVANGSGNTGDNVITGNASSNSLAGSDGNDTLDGGAGNDTLNGGLGDDVFIVDSSSDVVTEASGQGSDTVLSSAAFTLATNVENLTLTGSSNNFGLGNASNNILTGNSGDNNLSAGTGNDTLDGGGGADTLTGGGNSDTFTFKAATFGGVDTVTDFTSGSGNDVLDVHDILIGYSGTVTDFMRITDVGGNSKVEVDRDGTGGGFGWSQIATLNGITGLTDEAALVTSGNLLVT